MTKPTKSQPSRADAIPDRKSTPWEAHQSLVQGEVASKLQQALTAWSTVLGREHVLFDASQIQSYAKTTLPEANAPIAIIRPASVEEVVVVVQVAAELGVPLYPISRGKNWGYGDACPAGEGQVIVDLSRMDRITEFNEELGYAVVQPGVTQGQLEEEIRHRESRLMLDVTGAGPDASIVGNALERGFGHTPYGDHFAHSCNFEVVLADGTVTRTGFGSYVGSQAAHVFPAGLGPSLDGLFSQSNLGIVTEMTVWLMHRPEHVCAFALQLGEDSQLEEAIDGLRELKQANVLNSAVHVANDLRVMSALVACPEPELSRRVSLSLETRRRLRAETGTGAWNLLGGLYGDRQHIRWAKSRIQRRFKGIARPVFFDQRRLRLWNACARPFRNSHWFQSKAKKIASASSALDLLSGVPTREHLQGAFWRNVTEDSQSQDPVQAGLMWLSPVIPISGKHARALMTCVETTMTRFGFDPLTTLTAINSRAMCGVISINYDRGIVEQSRQANECYEALWKQLTEAGYLPYRCGIQSAGKLSSLNGNQSLLRAIKSTLDPRRILAPGRYGI